MDAHKQTKLPVVGALLAKPADLPVSRCVPRVSNLRGYRKQHPYNSLKIDLFDTPESERLVTYPPGSGDSKPYLPHSTTQPTTRSAAATGFTLLEVILAVTIAGALLAGAATLLVSITDAWVKRQDRNFFEDHVDGATEFIQACLSSAGQEIALRGTQGTNRGESVNEGTGPDRVEVEANPSQATPNAPPRVGIKTGSRATSSNTSASSTGSSGSSLLSVAEDPIKWSKPPGFARFRDPLLHFRLRNSPPLFVQTDNAPVIGVETFLYFERDEGLSLLWYTPLQEESEEEEGLRRTPISDLVTAIKYIYWDERFEKWEEKDEPMKNEDDEAFVLPRFLKLTFEYEGETKTRTLTIRVPSQSALLF